MPLHFDWPIGKLLKKYISRKNDFIEVALCVYSKFLKKLHERRQKNTISS